MSDPNHGDTNPDEPRSESPSQPGPWLPPRLREKLESPEASADDWKPKTGSPVPAIVTIAVVLVAAVGGFLWWRSASQKDHGGKNATAQAAPSPPPARMDSLAMARADSTARANSASTTTASSSPTTTGAAAAATPAKTTPAKTTPKEPVANAAPASAPSPAKGFGIVVGSYVFEEKAQSELTRLQGVTGLSGRVSPSATSGFNVILGKFATKTAAERKATAFVDSSLVDQAQVIALP